MAIRVILCVVHPFALFLLFFLRSTFFSCVIRSPSRRRRSRLSRKQTTNSHTPLKCFSLCNFSSTFLFCKGPLSDTISWVHALPTMIVSQKTPCEGDEVEEGGGSKLFYV